MRGSKPPGDNQYSIERKQEICSQILFLSQAACFVCPQISSASYSDFNFSIERRWSRIIGDKFKYDGLEASITRIDVTN
jgi:hypothetical protein